MTWLITSAVSSELETLRAFVASSSEEAGLIKGRINSTKVVLASLGIGSVEAAITLTRLLSSAQFERVYFVGTAGILPGCTLEIGEAVSIARVMPSRSVGERLVGAAFENIDTELTQAEDACNVWSSTGISETRDLAEHAAKFAAHVENMEIWGAARTCRRHEIPFGAFLGLSNMVGPDAHDEWKREHSRASAAACMMMADHIKESGFTASA